MAKKKVVVLMLSMLAVVCLHAQNDPVLMTVAGRNVTRSEFEYSLNKNNMNGKVTAKDEIRKYVDLFVDYRLKVRAALDAKLDTLSSFQKEYRFYRDAQLRSYVYDSVYADSVAHIVYDAIKESVGDSDVVMLSHILLRVPQNSSESVAESQKSLADSLCRALDAGADFADLARRFSQDKRTADNGGELGWLGPAQMVPEFRETVYSLTPGHYCRPFASPAGYHLIYMHDRKAFGSFAEMRQDILDNLNARGLREDAAEHEIKRMMEEGGKTLSREEVLLKIQSTAESQNPSLKYLLSEYYDGLLLYEATNKMVWQKAVDDNSGLEDFFSKNKDKYKWESPRFRGYVVKARSKDMLSCVTKILKKCKADEGLDMLKKQLPEDSLKAVNVHFGVYKAGDNRIVDKEVFKTADQVKENRLYPYYKVVGKKLKQPKDVVDVKNAVLSDFQNYQEQNWVKFLRKQYGYTVAESVLSTVNNHD